MRRNGTAAATFRETLEQHPRVLERGRYGPYLEAWREAFGDRFRVFLFDDLQWNPDQVARDLFAHLGVSLEFCSPRTRERVLPASKARSVAAASLAKQGARFLRAAGLPGIVGRAKGSALAKLLYRPLASGERYRPGTSELEWLTGYYAGDLPRMEAFLGRPLPGWPGSA
jgi:hypothetical protein